MAQEKLTATILVISNTASNDPSTDRVGGALSELFASNGGEWWDTPTIHVVPDDVLAIQHQIQQWTDGSEPVNLVLTSGGTGFTVQDNTPEVRNCIW